MFSFNKLVAKTIIRPDLTRSVCSARGKRFGYFNDYMSGRTRNHSGPNGSHEPFHKFYDHHPRYYYRRGWCPKLIIGMVILGLVVCKYTHTHRDQNNHFRDKGSLSNGENNQLGAPPAQGKDQSWEK